MLWLLVNSRSLFIFNQAGRGEKMLTKKQEQFALNVFNGMSYADAYREVYDCENCNNDTIYREAHELAKNHKVATRIKELRDEALEPYIMSAKERLKWLTEIVKDTEQSTRDRLSASDQMNKMQGEYVQKIEADVNQDVVVVIDLVE